MAELLTLDSLDDVAITNARKCDTLVYDECAGQWKNRPACSVCVQRRRTVTFDDCEPWSPINNTSGDAPLSPIAVADACASLDAEKRETNEWTLSFRPKQDQVCQLFCWDAEADPKVEPKAGDFCPLYHPGCGKAIVIAKSVDGVVEPCCEGGYIDIVFKCAVTVESVDLLNIDRYFPPTPIKTYTIAECPGTSSELCHPVALSGNIDRLTEKGIKQTVPICRQGVRRIRITLDGRGAVCALRYTWPDTVSPPVCESVLPLQADNECDVVVDRTVCDSLTLDADGVVRVGSLQAAFQYTKRQLTRLLEPSLEHNANDTGIKCPCPSKPAVFSCDPAPGPCDNIERKHRSVVPLRICVESLACEERCGSTVLYGQNNLLIKGDDLPADQRVHLHILDSSDVRLEGAWWKTLTVKRSKVSVDSACVFADGECGVSDSATVIHASDNSVVDVNDSRLEAAVAGNEPLVLVDRCAKVNLHASILLSSATGGSTLVKAVGGEVSMRGGVLSGKSGQTKVLVHAEQRAQVNIEEPADGEDALLLMNTGAETNAIFASRCSVVRVTGNGTDAIVKYLDIGSEIIAIEKASELCCVANSLAAYTGDVPDLDQCPPSGPPGPPSGPPGPPSGPPGPPSGPPGCSEPMATNETNKTITFTSFPPTVTVSTTENGSFLTPSVSAFFSLVDSDTQYTATGIIFSVVDKGLVLDHSLSVGTHSVDLVASNGEGCSVTISVTVVIEGFPFP